jgi:hypothetical protein
MGQNCVVSQITTHMILNNNVVCHIIYPYIHNLMTRTASDHNLRITLIPNELLVLDKGTIVINLESVPRFQK